MMMLMVLLLDYAIRRSRRKEGEEQTDVV